ncbi:hypothetical protein Poli38472_006351 [Pythium oligandrum]|uniref:urease n=1 Tax=Pythium oligandrum TaxID=41045 RepID=A0A8K1FBP4_PYTOL|nr:hypothetical protein Poli38472_006351 [Pythium oligandrum]|eukprot:TMW56341.1 hypothetical protein Poli38472_006351 [Pythium oligandrum]
MRLSPREEDHLLLHTAGVLAQKRLARGLRLNYTEAVALLATQVLEFIRDGKSVAELMTLGTQLLGRRHVLDGVAEILDEVQVEGTFPDGTKLVTIHHPIATMDGNLSLALYGSFLPIPSLDRFPAPEAMVSTPGDVITPDEDIVLNGDRQVAALQITNLSDRPIQVGSHYHLIETNPYLEMDRKRAYGYRLNIPSGTAVRFEPGDQKTVSIVPIGGKKVITGGNNLASGVVDPAKVDAIVAKAVEQGFHHKAMEDAVAQSLGSALKLCRMPRSVYAQTYGPTTGDVVRLGDMDLYIAVEKDFTVYGDECKFGGGKVLREGMGQASGLFAHQVLDTIITNALVIDYTGIYKADIGIKNGLISGIGKGGNPDVMEGVMPNMIVGVNTEVIAGEGLILTAGGFDAHVHFICPQLCTEALASGLTTLVGGGTGPATGTNATTCTPGPNHMRLMLQATDSVPMNIGLTGKGNTSLPEGLQDIIDAGAVGMKLHEDWGTTPAAIDTCLTVAENNDVQVTIHTDTLNESCCVEHTIAAFKGRTIHTYHSEGAGGGHAPDIITVCGELNVLPSSTNPTRPYTRNTIDEHVDMLMVCHHLDKNIAEDVAFAESRIRGETIAAEDLLHDMGAISIISSDSQAMGRIGEVVTRTWQTADKMKKLRGLLPEDAASPFQRDNFRVKRYVAKYTINPAIAHGMSHLIGSIETNKLADLCLWNPAFFGSKPEMIIKGGAIVYAQMGDPNASIPTPQPVKMRPMFGACGAAVGPTSVAFVSRSCVEKKVAEGYGLKKRIEAVKRCRGVTKNDMKLNDALPKIQVDPETYKVKADGGRARVFPTADLSRAKRNLRHRSHALTNLNAPTHSLGLRAQPGGPMWQELFHDGSPAGASASAAVGKQALIAELVTHTNFTTEHIFHMSRKFKEIAGAAKNVITFQEFRQIMGDDVGAMLEGIGVTTLEFQELATTDMTAISATISASESFLRRLFLMFDGDGDGKIDFREFVVGLNAFIKGSLEDKVETLFALYRADDQQYGNKPPEANEPQGEPTIAISELLGLFQGDRQLYQELMRCVDEYFARGEVREENVITEDEFVAASLAEPWLLDAITQPHPSSLYREDAGLRDALRIFVTQQQLSWHKMLELHRRMLSIATTALVSSVETLAVYLPAIQVRQVVVDCVRPPRTEQEDADDDALLQQIFRAYVSASSGSSSSDSPATVALISWREFLQDLAVAVQSALTLAADTDSDAKAQYFFELYDLDRDGVLSRTELVSAVCAGFAHFGPHMTEVVRVLEDEDRDHDGELTKTEYLRAARRSSLILASLYTCLRESPSND